MLTSPYKCWCQCVHNPATQLWIVSLCCCRCSLGALHTQKFNPTALMIVWPKHGMCRKIRLEQRPSWSVNAAVCDTGPLGTEGLTSQQLGVLSSPALHCRHLQEPSHLKGAVFPQLRPLSLEWSMSHNWSTQEWKDPNFLPQFGKRLFKALETTSQALFSLCGLTLPSFPLTGADPQKLPN